jgi:hypothetical protein
MIPILGRFLSKIVRFSPHLRALGEYALNELRESASADLARFDPASQSLISSRQECGLSIAPDVNESYEQLTRDFLTH